MTKASISLQDLRKRIYLKAKVEPEWRFWGLYVHVCKTETLREAYEIARRNKGAPGIDGVTFDAIEAVGREAFLEEIRDELIARTYQPTRNRQVEIPKDGGKVRTLGIPTIRDRVVQGALKLVLEPVFEADFQDGSYGYRPKRTAQQAVCRVEMAVVQGKTTVIDVDLASYFDTVRHDILLGKVAARINDDDVLALLKRILKAGGKRGVPQGGVISPLLSNLYLNEVDKMLERAKEATRKGEYDHVEYARYADDLVILIDSHRRWGWLEEAVYKRLLEELAELDVELNLDKTRRVNLAQGESVDFLGFSIRRNKTRRGKWGARSVPSMKARTKLLRQLKEVFGRFRSQPVDRVIDLINPILRGWVNYYRAGNAAKCFAYIQHWVEKKVRRHLMQQRGRRGFGWKRWSTRWIYEKLGLFRDYRIVYHLPKALPVQTAT